MNKTNSFFANPLPAISNPDYYSVLSSADFAYFSIRKETNSLYRLIVLNDSVANYHWQFVDNYLTAFTTFMHFSDGFHSINHAIYHEQQNGCEIYAFNNPQIIKQFLKKHKEVAKIAREYEKRRNAEPAVIF